MAAERIETLCYAVRWRVLLKYRDEKFMLPEPDRKLKRGDEVMIITHSRNIEKLHERWRA